MEIDAAYDRFPEDTSASIYTSGLLGEQYIALAPGASADYLGAGDAIRQTQSAVVLEELIGQFLFQQAQGG
jgi:phospholipid/cholesterol/gamma-HCH transport system substrate-binding protein